MRDDPEDSSELDLEPERIPSYSDEDLDKMVQAIAVSDGRWRGADDEDPIDLGATSWRPHLRRGDELCHVHVVPRLGEHYRRRIALASKAEKSVIVAGPLAAWYIPETLESLNELDVRAALLDEREGIWHVTEYRSVAHLIAMSGLRLPPPVLKRMGELNLNRAQAATKSAERGDRFEDVLALLFSQVSYFKIFEVNYENETEEIDLVVQNLRVRERNLPLTPIVCISGKNMSETVGVSALSTLEKKMSNRHGQCQLGFLCASGKIATTVDTDILRLSRTDKTIVPLDGAAIATLLADPQHLDDNVEKHVARAMLR